jgi:hypothetical protein
MLHPGETFGFPEGAEVYILERDQRRRGAGITSSSGRARLDCVVAGRLSQTMPDVRIALIEAGGMRLGLTTKVPGTAFIASTSPRRNWNF